MNWPGPERWERLWRAIGAVGHALPWYEQLSQAYREPHRHYHNQQHIAECLAEFDAARHLAGQPEAVELSLWFHDVVYDSKGADNEGQSAELARRCLESAARPVLANSVSELILATRHDGKPRGNDMAIVVDIDLSILGKPEHRFAEYEKQVREEYGWVSPTVFNSKRAEILRCFLTRDHIFTTDFFNERYEQTARQNLVCSIEKLGQGST